MIVNPYPGLRAFGETDSEFFFGREKDINAILAHLGGSHLLAVIGVSGCGKSSLVHAGLVPTLRTGLAEPLDVTWRIFTFFPGTSPIGALENALNTTLRRRSHALRDWAREQSPDERSLIIVDQFEEIFTFRDASIGVDGGNEAALFVDMLMTAVGDSSSPLYVVLTMRTDYLGQAAVFRDLAEALNANNYLVPRMSRTQLNEAIASPARAVGVEPQPALVQRLLADAQEDPDQLPVLEHLLKVMWEHKGDGPFDLALYLRLGGWQDALASDARSVLARFPEDKAAIVKALQWLSDTGIGTKPARRRRPFVELSTVTRLTNQRTNEIVDAFLERDLLQKDLTALSPLVSFTHESVMWHWQDLMNWLAVERADADRLSFYKAAARNKVALSGTTLVEARRLSNRLITEPLWGSRYLTNGERDQTLRWIDHSAKKKTRFVYAMASLAVIATTLGLFYVISIRNRTIEVTRQKIEMEQEKNLALANLLAAEAALQAEASPDKALTYAYLSAQRRQSPNTQLEQLIHNLLGENNSGIQVVMGAKQFRLSPDDSFWARSDGGHDVFWSAVDDAPKKVSLEYNVASIAFSDAFLAIAGGHYITLYSVDSNGEPIRLQVAGNISKIAWNATGSELAALDADGSLTVWESDKWMSPLIDHLQVVQGLNRALASQALASQALAWSPTGAELAVAGPKEIVLVGLDAFISKSPDTNTLAKLSTDTGAQSMDWSHDGKSLAVSTPLGGLLVFTKDAGVWEKTVYPQLMATTGVAWAPDDERLAVARWDGSYVIGSKNDSEFAWTLRSTNTSRLKEILWSSDGHYVFTRSEVGVVMKWDTLGSSEGLSAAFPIKENETVFAMGVSGSSSSASVAMGSNAGRFGVWGTLRGPINNSGKEIRSLAWDIDGKRLFLAQTGLAGLGIYSLAEQKLGSISGDTGLTHVVVGGQYVGVVGAGNKGTRLFDLSRQSSTVLDADSPIIGLATRGEHVAEVTSTGELRVWTRGLDGHFRMTTRKDIGVSNLNRSVPISFSPDQSLIAVGMVDRVEIFEAKTMEASCNLAGIEPTDIAWSNFLNYLAVGENDGRTSIWRVSLKACPAQPYLTLGSKLVAKNPIRAISWTADGKMLLTVTRSGTVRSFILDHELLMKAVLSRVSAHPAIHDSDCRTILGGKCSDVGAEFNAPSPSSREEGQTVSSHGDVMFCDAKLGVQFRYDPHKYRHPRSDGMGGVISKSFDNVTSVYVTPGVPLVGTTLGADLSRRLAEIGRSTCEMNAWGGKGDYRTFSHLEGQGYIVTGCAGDGTYYERVIIVDNGIRRIRAVNRPGGQRNYMDIIHSFGASKDCGK